MNSFLKKMFSAQTEGKGTQRRVRHTLPQRGSLNVESLEGRELLSICSLSSGTLTITGTNYSDEVKVEIDVNDPTNVFDDGVVVRTRQDQVIAQAQAQGVLLPFGWRVECEVPRAEVLWVRFDGGNGNDRFENLTTIPSAAYGGYGNDTLRGGASADRLYGGEDDDQLYGGAGNDTLNGGAGRDGLLGGSDKDSLIGGAGPDRFLQTLRLEDYESYKPKWWEVWKLQGLQIADTYVDKTAEDVTVRFKDGAAIDVLLNGETTRFAEGHWTDAEILVVDEAFGVMAQRTNNNVLLRRHDGSELIFTRLGTATTPTGMPSTYRGFNSNNGTISLADGAFDSGDGETHQVVFHEIGHNWDDEGAAWWSFRSLSGWRIHIPADRLYGNPFTRYKTYIIDRYANTQGFTVSTDGKWLYRNGSGFARAYGRENPYEDFATSWEAYFMNYSGEPYIGGGGAAAIPVKVSLIDNYLESLVT